MHSPAADERLLPGPWESDLLLGVHNRSATGVLEGRRTLFLMIVRMDGTSAQPPLVGLSQASAPLPAELRQPLSYDQDKEMALHAELAASTSLSIYFTDPNSLWQRASARTPANRNTRY